MCDPGVGVTVMVCILLRTDSVVSGDQGDPHATIPMNRVRTCAASPGSDRSVCLLRTRRSVLTPVYRRAAIQDHSCRSRSRALRHA
jgi:hypothetical protein